METGSLPLAVTTQMARRGLIGLRWGQRAIIGSRDAQVKIRKICLLIVRAPY
jgi:hypothetical protein